METRQLAFSSSFIAILIVLTSTLAPGAAAAPYGMDVVRVSPTTVLASPGETVTVTANVTNTGTNVDTFSLTLKSDSRYTTSLPVSSITLEPGTSLDVSYTVTTPANWYLGTFELRIVSAGEANVNINLVTRVETPILVTVTPNDTRLSITGQSVTGVVTATYLNGEPHMGASVLVRAFTNVAPGVFVPGTGKTYTTSATGTAAYDLGQNLIDHTPGTHTVRATIERPGASPATGSATYRV